LLPLERVDEVVEHWPERCRACAHALAAGELAVAAPQRHQVAELPPIAVRVSEHRLHRKRPLAWVRTFALWSRQSAYWRSSSASIAKRRAGQKPLLR
jgi:hypothetical protein